MSALLMKRTTMMMHDGGDRDTMMPVLAVTTTAQVAL